MKQSIKCIIGLHKYEVYKEEPIFNIRKEIIGKAIISRCSICGKIHVDKIYIVENN